MSTYKVTDVRVRYRDSVSVLIDGLGVSDEPRDLSGARAAVILDVFNSGRDLYWNDIPFALMTDPILFDREYPASPFKSGVVASWDVRVAQDGEIVFFLTLLGGEQPATSGIPAMGWARMEVAEQDAPPVVGILNSAYCFFDNGELRNSDL